MLTLMLLDKRYAKGFGAQIDSGIPVARRRYLLEQAGLDFTVVPSDFDEDSVKVTEPPTTSKSSPKKRLKRLPGTILKAG
jgi:hypothetical protein